jgi:predicted dienelactone hydrolase
MKTILTAKEITALCLYAQEHGRLWKQALRDDWMAARARGERGVILHNLRNNPDFGPRGLEAFSLPRYDVRASSTGGFMVLDVKRMVSVSYRNRHADALAIANTRNGYHAA